MANIKRLFFAATIDSKAINENIIPELKGLLKFDSISWARNQQTHLTLKFLGDTPLQNVKLLNKIFVDIAKKHSSYDIKLKNVKIFGSRYKPQVIWIGIEDNGETKKIYQDIQKELYSLGFKDKPQNFVPHITLGRIRKIDDKNYFQKIIDKYSDFEAETIKIDNLILFESQLTTKGAIHIPIEKYMLSSNL